MNVRNLEDDDIAKLRMLLGTSAWQEVLKPILMGRLEVLKEMLVLPQSERGEKGSDDSSLRGGIKELRWVLTKPEQIVAQYDHTQRLDERDKEPASR